ncbi:hypothetical protein WJX81_006354 [Elliptochloris bilobata]|uniref:Uncharacterized protein n=1 Tax=Elliptochloris bilobata TaxID=381761 RepID=A0AAW1QNH3_9CHLO
MHLLPCSITHTGSANVSAYFKPTDSGHAMEDRPVLEATFRGRQLRGAELKLPVGYTGFLLEAAAGETQAPALGPCLAASCHTGAHTSGGA